MVVVAEAEVPAGRAEVLARTAPGVPVRMTAEAVPVARVVPEDLAARHAVPVRMTAGPVPVVQAAPARMARVAPVRTVRVKTGPRATGPRVTVVLVLEVLVRRITMAPPAVPEAPAGIAAVVLVPVPEDGLISAAMSGVVAQAALMSVLT